MFALDFLYNLLLLILEKRRLNTLYPQAAIIDFYGRHSSLLIIIKKDLHFKRLFCKDIYKKSLEKSGKVYWLKNNQSPLSPLHQISHLAQHSQGNVSAKSRLTNETAEREAEFIFPENASLLFWGLVSLTPAPCFPLFYVCVYVYVCTCMQLPWSRVGGFIGLCTSTSACSVQSVYVWDATIHFPNDIWYMYVCVSVRTFIVTVHLRGFTGLLEARGGIFAFKNRLWSSCTVSKPVLC